jgi:hypothetical protein
MINGIKNRLDQVSSHPLSFNFNGLNSNFSPHVFSIIGRYMETRVYMGDRSSSHMYNPIYIGKVKHEHLYEAIHVTIINLFCVQVREQDFEMDLTQKMVSPL